jgi:hypothetical protein
LKKNYIKICKTIILPVVLLGVKLGLSHKGKTRLKVFENRVLRRIFGAKKEEVAGGWRRVYNEELHNF